MNRAEIKQLRSILGEEAHTACDALDRNDFNALGHAVARAFAALMRFSDALESGARENSEASQAVPPAGTPADASSDPAPSRFTSPREFPCPACAAKAGEPCMVRAAEPPIVMPAYHSGREDIAAVYDSSPARAASVAVATPAAVSPAPEPAAPAVAPAARVPGAGFGAAKVEAAQHAMPGDPCPRCGAAPNEGHRLRGCKPRVGGPLP